MNQATVDRALKALASINGVPSAFIPAMPRGVRLVRWEPKPAPVILTRASVVTDVERFITATLAQIGSLLSSTKSEPRKLRDLIDALEECGCIVEVPGIGSGGGRR